jgi:hypothetical protein
MSIFAKSTNAAPLKTTNIRPIALFYASILLVMAVAQLFSFPAFVEIVNSFWLPGGRPYATFLATLIVICEVFALPFLLRMRQSLAARAACMALGWMAGLIWLKLSLWLVLTTNAVTNIGIVGDVVVLRPGWWAVLFSLSLVVLAAWAAWGMWPLRRRQK